jgi:hypothetical protein
VAKAAAVYISRLSGKKHKGAVGKSVPENASDDDSDRSD